ncbi:MAG: aa3-type cytochrome c oxidase subunit IV [Parasphingorhabdus sp.]
MTSDNNNMKFAEETYGRFLSWLKVGSIIAALVAILVITLLVT